jgi:hypothetical protein
MVVNTFSHNVYLQMHSLFPSTIIRVFPSFSRGAEAVLDFLCSQLPFDLCVDQGSPDPLRRRPSVPPPGK